MSVRRRRLKRLVNTLEDNDIFDFNINNFDSRIRLQKYVYLLSHFTNMFRYGYNSYLRGPYSPSLARDYYRLDEVNINDYIEVHPDFLNLVEEKTTRWLELASTILMLKKRYNDDEIEELVDHVVRNKDSSVSFVREIVD